MLLKPSLEILSSPVISLSSDGVKGSRYMDWGFSSNVLKCGVCGIFSGRFFETDEK